MTTWNGCALINGRWWPLGSRVAALALSAGLLMGADRPPLPRQYRASIAVLVAGATADVASSWGRRELNPLVRTSEGKFSPARAIPLKAGIVAGTLLLERWALKSHPRAAKALAKINFAIGGAQLGVAARNWRTR